MSFREMLKRVPFLVWAVRRALEARGAGLRWMSRRLQRTRIRQYVATHDCRKLQVGALGHYLEGWLNTDVAPSDSRTVFLDATKPFPIPDNSFDAVFAEHMFEHIPYKDGQHMLRECFRILKPALSLD